MKIPRIPLAAVLLSATSPILFAADSVVVFNEIHYHPADPLNDTEWVELRSLMGVNVDMSGWELEGGINHTFAEGTVIPGHGFLLVAADPNHASLAGRNALGPFTGQLSNGGEGIRLVNNNDRTMDDVSYGDDNDWPVGPDGSGTTLAKRDQNTADARPANWVSSPEIGGTPGTANFPLAGQPPVVTPILTLASSWKFRETNTPPPANWDDPAFDDIAWPSGDSVFFAGAAQPTGAGEGLLGYWPLNETSGTTASNAAPAGTDAQLVNGPAWVNDATRGRVLDFNGGDAYANAGATTIPQMTTGNDFTWSMWAFDRGGANNNVIFGNRFSPGGGEFSPREFIKFTTNQFEYHRGGAGENIDYAAIPTNTWIHHAVVKDGSSLTYYRNGAASGSGNVSQGTNNAQPLYFGGDQTNENWNGRLDDPAIWERALPASSVAGLADGTFTPLTAPTIDGAGGGALDTELTLGSPAYYFRHDFIFSGNPARTTLTLQLLLDDGAVIYLNGTEVHRQNLAAGAVSHGTFAENTVTDATLSSGIALSPTNLLQGANTIAVEVHQASAGSSDMVFGAILSATEQPPQPGEFVQDVVFSEIAAASDANFQIELANTGATHIDLTGYELRSSSGASQTLSGVLNTGAQLAISPAFTPADGDRLFLFRPGGVELADARSVTKRLRGLSGDRWLYPSAPSFGSANTFAFSEEIVISEIMYNPRPFPAEPAPLPEVIVDWDAVWRYNESGDDLGNTWETANHPLWPMGIGPLGVESPGQLPHEIATPLAPLASHNPRVVTFYFETDFTLSAQQRTSIAAMEITHQIDDGAIFYINGVEAARFNMNGEPTTAATTASPSVGNASEATIAVTAAALNALLTGTNRLSVEVHQSAAGSSDVVFGMQLNSTRSGLPFRNSDEQWIELFNKGASEIDLSGWEFSDGISFVFPQGTMLDTGEFLVVARDPVSLGAKFPGVTVVGPWSGSLSRKGERLRLLDANKNPADEVRYYDGGRWPEFADGGGSSLELRDTDADNNAADAWAASVESGDWQTISYAGQATSTPGNDPTRYHEFIFGLLDAGEFLIDDVSVIENPSGTARELIQNGDFSGGAPTFWRMRGTHRHAEVIDDPDSAGNNVLHVRASGAMEHMHNHAETTLKAGGSFVTISSSQTYRISFRAKWLGGSNQLNTRLYFNRNPRTSILDAPEDGGTPGAANSQQLSNAGPTYSGLTHAPAVPAANVAATVSVAAEDPDGIASMTLFYSVNGGGLGITAMIPGIDGSYSGTIPGQSGGAKAQFYIQARDSMGATEFFPAAGPDSRAIIPWDDGQANLDYGNCQPNNFRITMTTADSDFLHTVTEVMGNDRIGCTVIYNEEEIYYDCGVRLKGSQRGRAKTVRAGFNVRFPDNQKFLGCHETVAVDRSGAGDQFSQKEILVKHAINHAGGIPGMEDDLIRVIAPRTAHTGSAMLLKSRFDNEWLENWIPNGDNGRMFEYELIYYPTSTTGGVEGDKNPNPDSVVGVSMRNVGSTDKEDYRYHWQIKNNKDADDFSGLIGFLTTMGLNGTEFRDATDAEFDVDQWLRAFAVQVLFGIGDNYSSGSQHNAIFYLRPDDGKVVYFPWDMDFTFSRGATADLTPNGDLDKLIAASPANERAYYGHIYDIVTTTCNTDYMTEWANHYSCFLPTENLAGHLSYIGTRSSSALNAVNSAVAMVPYRITTPNNTSTAQSSVTLQGDGWVDLRELRLASSGAVLPITWIDDNTWQVTVPVAPGANSFTIEAYDHQGNQLGSDSVNITGTGTLVPATAANLAISEMMYHPADPSIDEQNAGFLDADAFEFVELQNLSNSLTLDLASVSFADGIAFDLPSTTLAPGARAIIAGNQAAFSERYGAGFPVIGQYQTGDSNKLSNNGEHVLLNDAAGAPIADFTYADSDPWPSSADGSGYSLVLMCPGTNDPADPRSWRTSATIGGNPDAGDAIDLASWMTANGVADLFLDHEGDGLAAILEYTGRIRSLQGERLSPVDTGFENVQGQAHLAIVFRQRIGADEIDLGAQHSSNLGTWSGDMSYVGRTNNDDGTSSVRFRSNIPFIGSGREFLRVVGSAKP